MPEPQQQEIKLTWDEWVRRFHPIRNPFTRNNRDDYAFETFGKEHALVTAMQATHPCCIWTFVDDDGGSCMMKGYHVVNRQLYYLTEVPADEGISYIIDEYLE